MTRTGFHRWSGSLDPRGPRGERRGARARRHLGCRATQLARRPLRMRSRMVRMRMRASGSKLSQAGGGEGCKASACRRGVDRHRRIPGQWTSRTQETWRLDGRDPGQRLPRQRLSLKILYDDYASRRPPLWHDFLYTLRYPLTSPFRFDSKRWMDWMICCTRLLRNFPRTVSYLP